MWMNLIRDLNKWFAFVFIVQDKEMLNGPGEYGGDDGKFTEYYRA